MVTQAKIYVGGNEWSLNKAIEICSFVAPDHSWEGKYCISFADKNNQELGYIDIDKNNPYIGRVLGTKLLKIVLKYPQFRQTILRKKDVNM